MTDEQTRRRERRYRETGSPEDFRAYVGARVHSGHTFSQVFDDEVRLTLSCNSNLDSLITNIAQISEDPIVQKIRWFKRYKVLAYGLLSIYDRFDFFASGNPPRDFDRWQTQDAVNSKTLASLGIDCIFEFYNNIGLRYDIETKELWQYEGGWFHKIDAFLGEHESHWGAGDEEIYAQWKKVEVLDLYKHFNIEHSQEE